MVKTYRKFFTLLAMVIFVSSSFPYQSSAEYKSDIPSGQNIPKIEVTPNDPKLVNGHVYPNWGPICQRYIYSVIYVDDKGRAPEYVKIYFNGNMIDMEKEDPKNNDYISGVRYVYKYVPNKLGSNFYFFEASNGLGKARSSIIDSPDNGPVLFKNAFDKNEVAVVDAVTKTKILSYDLKDEWVGGVALSDDGKYLAVKTHKKVYLFDTTKPNEPVWAYEGAGEKQGDVKGGVDISGDGTRIFASIGGSAVLLSNESNKPLWVYRGSGNSAYNAAISKDGKYMAVGTAGSVSSTTQGYKSSEATNLLILWNEKSEVPLWQYHAEGNFHDVSLSDDGSYVSGATGCPDRRAYLFSKDSNTPIIKSEMLTKDSPVHRAKISGDGQYVAVGSESSDGAVFLFSKNSDKPLWKMPMPGGSSARALNFTSDGSFIGAATFNGDAYVFGRDSNVPVLHWKVDASLGGIDIAEDGSFVAAGGTDNKLHIFSKGSTKPFDVSFNEYVEEVDISANGKYIAAGTGGSVYFFEAFDGATQATVCKEIKEPPVENTENNVISNNITFPKNSDAVNNDIKTDDVGNVAPFKISLPGMLFGFGFLGSLIALAGYLMVVKYNLVSKKDQSEVEAKAIGKKGLKINKKIIVVISVIGLIFLALTIISVVVNVKNNQGVEQTKVPVPEESQQTKGEAQKTGCGNGVCEPDFGETKANCPGDCSS